MTSSDSSEAQTDWEVLTVYKAGPLQKIFNLRNGFQIVFNNFTATKENIFRRT